LKSYVEKSIIILMIRIKICDDASFIFFFPLVSN